MEKTKETKEKGFTREELLLTYALGVSHALLFVFSIIYPVPKHTEGLVSLLLRIWNGTAAGFFLGFAHLIRFHPDELHNEKPLFDSMRYIASISAVCYISLTVWALGCSDISQIDYKSAYHFLVVVPITHMPFPSIVVTSVLSWVLYLGAKILLPA